GLCDEPDILGALVALVAQQRGLLVLDQGGELFDQVGLLHLVGDLGDDDLVGAAAGLLLFPERAQATPAAAGLVGVEESGVRLDDDAAGGEVGALHVDHQVGGGGLGVVEQ